MENLKLFEKLINQSVTTPIDKNFSYKNNKFFTNTPINTTATYDSQGAAKYVIVVIIWYFLGVASFVVWQIKRKKGSNDYKTELLLQAMEDQVKTKQILEELRNPEMRKWAWEIYRNGNKNKQSNISNEKYEMQVLANLDKRINKIERRKQRYHDSYGINTNIYKPTFTHEDDEDSFTQSWKSKLKDVRISVLFSKAASLNKTNRSRRQTLCDVNTDQINQTNHLKRCRKISEQIELKHINEKYNNLYGYKLEAKRNFNVSFANEKTLVLKDLKDFSRSVSIKMNKISNTSLDMKDISSLLQAKNLKSPSFQTNCSSSNTSLRKSFSQTNLHEKSEVTFVTHFSEKS